MTDDLFVARNIINQIGDLWSEKIPSDLWVPVRQATNDELDTFVLKLIRSAESITPERIERAAEAMHRHDHFYMNDNAARDEWLQMRPWRRQEYRDRARIALETQ